MNSKFAQGYQEALLAHLEQGPGAGLQSARDWGQKAQEARLQTLDLAKLHEQVLVKGVLLRCTARKRAVLIKQAGAFFAELIAPTDKTHRTAQEAAAHLNRVVEMLSQRTVELLASNLELKLEIAQRKMVEEALKKSERHHSQLLEQSDHLQQQLRQLSRQILSAQEDERKEISRELHDVIGQTLTGITIRLAALKKEAAINTKGLNRNIARTQRLVETSVNIVHRFARALRPAVLDDLGLIPALHSFMKTFTAQTGVRANLTAFKEVEQLDAPRRTVLFRVAQEALNNVARHAEATRVEVSVHRLPKSVCMRIRDDGKSFKVGPTLHANGGKRLGLLGMRERVEMVGGSFVVESEPGKGTTIVAQIPMGKARTRRSKTQRRRSLNRI